MKIAISSKGKDLNSQVDSVFGRCSYFIIVEVKDEKIGNFEAMENKSANQTGGAGISAAQAVAEKKVNAVITGNIGPRALDVFKQFNIEIYKGQGLIKKTIQKLIDNKLEKIEK